MYKRMGLSSDVVCEVGKWKNLSAFKAHLKAVGAGGRRTPANAMVQVPDGKGRGPQVRSYCPVSALQHPKSAK